jgi:hypothetical protein
MKNFIALLIASLIVGFGCYLLFYFIFGMDRQNAITIAFSTATAGLVVQYLRPYFPKPKKK